MSQSSQTTPDSLGLDNIWLGPQYSRRSAASLESRMELLSLLSGHEESIHFGHSPSGGYQQPSLSRGPWTPLPHIPAAQLQLQPPTSGEQIPGGQPSLEQLPRPPTRRSNYSSSIQPQMTASANNTFFGPASQSRSIRMPQPQLPRPPTDHIAIYLAAFEGHPRHWDPTDTARVHRRNCSIIVQYGAQMDKFREFCCIATPQRRPKRHVMFYSSPEMPDPRWSAPGLLAMQFIAWVPRVQIAELDMYMKTWRGRVNESWTHTTWIGIYLEHLLNQNLITTSQIERTKAFQQQSFRLPYTVALPNDQQCFPHMY